MQTVTVTFQIQNATDRKEAREFVQYILDCCDMSPIDGGYGESVESFAVDE